MWRVIHALIFVLLVTSAFAQQSQVIVPASAAPLKRNFIFTNPASGTVILIYERRVAASASLKLEVRRQKDLSLIRQYSIPTSSALALRQAGYRQPASTVLAVVQNISDGSLHTISINEKSGASQRFNLSIGSKTPAVGLTWNSTLDRWAFIAGPTLVSLDLSGRPIGTAPASNAKGTVVDMAFNGCSSQYAVITTASVRLLNGAAALLTSVPEEITSDPSNCRYQVIRFERNSIVHLLSLDSGLKLQSDLRLPGQIAEGLIADSRNIFVLSKSRKSILYATVEGHSHIYLNEIKNGKVSTIEIKTPIESASYGMAAIGKQVFFLLSGLTTSRSTHTLALQKVTLPPAALR